VALRGQPGQDGAVRGGVGGAEPADVPRAVRPERVDHDVAHVHRKRDAQQPGWHRSRHRDGDPAVGGQGERCMRRSGEPAEDDMIDVALRKSLLLLVRELRYAERCRPDRLIRPPDHRIGCGAVDCAAACTG
jgi:hypothetical protein